MATCPVRFEFQCEGAEVLKFVHNIPRSLINAQAQAAQREPGYAGLFMSSVLPIMKEHEAACRDASNPFCENCGGPLVKVLQTPTSWLHNVGDPFVVVWVNPVCGKGECETRTRQEITAMMDEFAGQGNMSGSRMCVEITACGVCGKTEETMRCGRCRVAAYCGKEHQRADWQEHKKSCVPRDGERR